MSGSDVPLSFTFDWRLSETAKFAGDLNRDVFGGLVWRVAKWVILVMLLGAVVIGLFAAIDGKPEFLIAATPWILILLLWLFLSAKRVRLASSLRY